MGAAYIFIAAGAGWGRAAAAGAQSRAGAAEPRRPAARVPGGRGPGAARGSLPPPLGSRPRNLGRACGCPCGGPTLRAGVRGRGGPASASGEVPGAGGRLPRALPGPDAPPPRGPRSRASAEAPAEAHRGRAPRPRGSARGPRQGGRRAAGLPGCAPRWERLERGPLPAGGGARRAPGPLRAAQPNLSHLNNV